MEFTTNIVQNLLTEDMIAQLNQPFTPTEIYNTIHSMKSLSAPGPDGLPTLFYQHYWSIIGTDIIALCLDILNSGKDPSSINHTNIWLIPKNKNPNTPKDFRPIALCNVTLKIITKIIANRLKPILPSIISENQSAFIPGKLITNNTVLAFDIFHYFKHTNSKNSFVAIKTDMEKAYDHIEWKFIQATMLSMGFPNQLVSLIMKCITTVSYIILLNGRPSTKLKPQRGIRQGDPLSPYMFIICVNVFSALISKAQKDKRITGVKIAPGAPNISHLFFADDSVIFCKANKFETNNIKHIIDTYQQASGQLVRMAKYEMIFSKKVDNLSKSYICYKHSSYTGCSSFLKVPRNANNYWEVKKTSF